MMCSFPRRRTIHERNVGIAEGGLVGRRSVSSGCGAGRSNWVFLRTSFSVGGEFSFARAGQASTSGGATYAGAEFDKRTESTSGCDPAAASHRGESNSRSDGCTDRSGPSKRTRPNPSDPHAEAQTKVGSVLKKFWY